MCIYICVCVCKFVGKIMHNKNTRYVHKIIRAQQGNTHTYKKIKLLKTSAAIWFNKMCRTKQVTPTHIPASWSACNII